MWPNQLMECGKEYFIIFFSRHLAVQSQSSLLRGKSGNRTHLLYFSSPQKLASHSGLEYDKIENSDSAEDNYGTFIFRILLFLLDYGVAYGSLQ